jgi:hypothetical protein
VAREEKRNAFWDLVGKAERKRQLKDLTLDGGNFKACVKDNGMGWYGVD